MAYRLLIVPGENEALRALQHEFASDVEVHVADSANDALWEVRQSPPTAIVADVDLPGMSGLDLAEILPNFGVPTKVVLWSRTPDAQAQRQATSVGVQHFLSGPHTQEQLKHVLYEAMSSAQAASAPEPEPAAPPQPEARPTPTPAPTAMPTAAAPERPRRERPAAPPPPAPTPARRPLSRRREGPIVLTAENLTPMRTRMTELVQEVGAQCILLTDRAGMVLTEVGKTAGIPTMILLPLLSTSFSAAGQISQMLRDNESSALYMQEGSHYDLYCFDVLQAFMLVLVFDKAASATKIGTVWVYAKRAIRDMQEYLA